MIKHFFTYLFIVCLSFSAYAQCPKFYEKDGSLSSSPVFVNCDKANFAVNIRSDVTTGSYTITWGDGSPNATGSSIAANDFVSHSYPTTIGSYTITLNFNNGASYIIWYPSF